MTRAIVCGIDGSPDSQAALAFANDLAEWLETRFVLVARRRAPLATPYATV